MKIHIITGGNEKYGYTALLQFIFPEGVTNSRQIVWDADSRAIARLQAEEIVRDGLNASASHRRKEAADVS